MFLKNKSLRSGVLSLLLVGPQIATASVELAVEVGAGRTDNITRATDTLLDPAIEDTVYSAGVSIAIDHESASTEADVRASLFWHDYQDAPYESETLPALDATALFRITDQAFSWFVRGNVGQRSVDPFQPVTPGNREDVSYITTGPRFFIPLGSRFSLRADAWYSDVRYEIQPSDNTRQGGQLGIVRQINPSRSLSLNVRGERTEFDLDELLAPIERYDAFIQFTTEGSRNDVTVDLGFSRAKRSGESAGEPLLNVEWRRQISPATSFELAGGTRISDAADSFRGDQQNSSDIGQTQIQQDVTDIFRNDYLRLGFAYERTRTNIAMGLEWSDQDYGDSLSERNRQVERANLSATRQLGRSWVGALFGRLERNKYEMMARHDDDLSAGASLTWTRLRTLEIELRLDYFERDSTDSTNDFTENRAFIGLRYSPQLGR